MVTPAAFLQWAKHRAPAVLRSMKALLSGDGSKGLVPQLIGLRSSSGLLQVESAWGLAGLLPPKQQVSVSVPWLSVSVFGGSQCQYSFRMYGTCQRTIIVG